MRDKYLDLARELKYLWNMRVTLMPIVVGALETVAKDLESGMEELEIGGLTESLQTNLLRSAFYWEESLRLWDLRRVLETFETWGDLLSFRFHLKDTRKSSHRVKIMRNWINNWTLSESW